MEPSDSMAIRRRSVKGAAEMTGRGAGERVDPDDLVGAAREAGLDTTSEPVAVDGKLGDGSEVVTEGDDRAGAVAGS